MAHLHCEAAPPLGRQHRGLRPLRRDRLLRLPELDDRPRELEDQHPALGALRLQHRRRGARGHPHCCTHGPLRQGQDLLDKRALWQELAIREVARDHGVEHGLCAETAIPRHRHQGAAGASVLQDEGREAARGREPDGGVPVRARLPHRPLHRLRGERLHVARAAAHRAAAPEVRAVEARKPADRGAQPPHDPQRARGRGVVLEAGCLQVRRRRALRAGRPHLHCGREAADPPPRLCRES
mmetsp:Transcript_103514/g.322487  ORF Transcript_103514/g.322487 Transcript_103514/m.322487 type:complete len:240 (-) Transcript_103514:869-1588(-)